MCGIAGWIDWEADLKQQKMTITYMTESMNHRGPDASGYWLSEHAALGHRRLSVVDPEGGGQPMIRQIGEKVFVVTYNGELYNTQDIKKELQELGHDFYNKSDTEVLLMSYIEWGSDCVKKFNGIYAFGIWDESEQSLFLARDRLGVKPLFYSPRKKSLLFGSEIKAILAHPYVEPVVETEGLAEIFFIGPARTSGHGIFQDIFELKPGHFLIFNRDGIKIKKYWSLESHTHTDDVDATAICIRELFKDSVERQLVADVPVCTFLSGGLDSSAITAYAIEAFKKQGINELHTYSIDYVGNDKYFKPNDFQPNSDPYWVKRVSEFLGTEHHYITVDIPEVIDALTDALRAKDLPGMADVDSSLLLFCREVKKNATVALSGECADEIFGGYPWFHREDLFNAKTFPWSLSIDERKSVVNEELLKYIDADEYIDYRYNQSLKEVPILEGENAEEARRRELFYLNINWFMGNLLERKDRMSMATGLEVRVPFCDHRLVEYVWNIPWSIKSHNDREKGILRQALKGILPKDVLDRKKSPYPKTHSPDYLDGVSRWLSDILENKNSPIHNVVNTKLIKEMLKSKDYELKRPWFGQLMNTAQLYAYLIQINIWLNEYKISIKI
jgi:asparagine synthase (glutamine-hydrolysing)